MLGLVGCEFTATVRDAFLAEGHDFYSNDILETEGNPERHLCCDVFDAIASKSHWDIIILHPECTYMAVCGNKHYGEGHPLRQQAVEWTERLWRHAKAHSNRVALENPASVIFPVLRRAGANVQYVQPWQFGHLEQKKTGLALHGLPPLVETDNVYARMMQLPKNERERIFYMAPGVNRQLERSRFYPNIAAAMANQWGNL